MLPDGNSKVVKISVIIIAYLRKDYLINAVESVLNQDFDRSKYEIIVIKNFNNSYIDKYLSSKGITNFFSSEASVGMKFVEGIHISKGDIICLLEDDDVFLKNKLREVYNIFNVYPELSYFHNNASFVYENGEPIKKFSTFSFRKISGHGNLYVKNKDKDNEVFKLFDLGAYWNNSCISIRKSYFLYDLEILGHIKTLFDGAIFFSALCSNGDILITARVLNLYRINRNSATQIAKLDNETHSRISTSNLGDNLLIQDLVRRTLGSKSKTFKRLMIDKTSWDMKKIIYSKSSKRHDAVKYFFLMISEYKLFPRLIKSNLFQISGLFLFIISPRISRRARIA